MKRKCQIQIGVLFLLVTMFSSVLLAQKTDFPNFRPYDQNGTDIFETPKDMDTEFNGVRVRVGGAFTQQYQSLSHENGFDQAAQDTLLYDLKPGFNLATANLNLDVLLYDGINLNLVTYLSSRHHPEAWVKGGYIQFDKLKFLNSEFFDNIMEYVTIKVGHMEVNYGDTHFRRTDNGNAMYNPFVGNYIMDAFNTEIGGEVYFRKNGILAMVGLTGGEINGNIGAARTSGVDDSDARGASIIGKVGYDSDLSDKLRLRVTGSIYTTGSSSSNHIYTGDRGGSRYYLVMSEPGSRAGDDFRTGRFSPGFSDEVTALMFNVFVKAKPMDALALEFFGTYEMASGRSHSEDPDDDLRNANQIGAELLLRLGKKENIYLGGRYNMVTSDLDSQTEISIDRIQVGAGWFITKNVLAKLEYVTQNYNDYPRLIGTSPNRFYEGQFSGLMVEAVVGF